MPSFLNKKNEKTTFEGFEEKDLRIKANYFKSHFQHVQIFKSDLLKQQYMQILKCGEVEFYETEFAYTIPMLESIQLRIKVIHEVLF